MRVPVIAGNWKMNMTIREALSLAEALKIRVGSIENPKIILCPPFTALDAVGKAIRNTKMQLGAQDLFWEKKGAYTGEISAEMLLDLNCKYVIIAHSERRQHFHETDASANRKVFAALDAGLSPILCVGETLEERESNFTFSVVELQIRKGLAELSPAQMNNVVIAYEPVWAIGTGKNATPAQANEVQGFIRNILREIFGLEISSSTIIQYGGSVKPDNISDLITEEEVDGALVGGASLNPDSFSEIILKSKK